MGLWLVSEGEYTHKPMRPLRRIRSWRDLRLRAWQWAQANRTDDGSLPSGRLIAPNYGRHERWGRLVKHAGLAGEFATGIMVVPAVHGAMRGRTRKAHADDGRTGSAQAEAEVV